MLALLALWLLDCSPTSWRHPLSAPWVVAAGKVDVDGDGVPDRIRIETRDGCVAKDSVDGHFAAVVRLSTSGRTVSTPIADHPEISATMSFLRKPASRLSIADYNGDGRPDFNLYTIRRDGKVEQHAHDQPEVYVADDQPSTAMIDAYRDLRRELMTKYPDWNRASLTPDFAKALNRGWRMVGNVAAEYLRAHPDADAKELAAAVETLNGGTCPENDEVASTYELAAEALPLGGGAFVVSATYAYVGTFFIIDSSGMRWSIKDVAARHYAKRDEIGKWAWIGFGWGDGPLIPQLRPLPATRDGHPRFAVDANTGTMIGGTYAQQISVWEWTGRAVRPQFIRSYWISFETGAVEVKANAIRIPIKGSYKTLHSCGQCVEPVVIWTLRVTPDGVRDAGKVHVVRELETVDELFDRVVHGKSTKELAAPRVAATLHRLMGDAGPDGYSLGMFEWHIREDSGRRVLELLADEMECGPWRFEVQRRAGGTYFSDVRIAERCDSLPPP